MYHINNKLALHGIRHHPGMSGLLDDVVNLVVDTGKDTKKSAEDTVKNKTSEFATELVSTPEFKEALSKVVVSETKKNAFVLFTLSVAAGSIGGALFKGKGGLIASGIMALGSTWMLMNGGKLMPDTAKKK